MQGSISIHAPKPGATRPGLDDRQVGQISIHAPKPGATARPLCIGCSERHFNPRSQAGSDLYVGVYLFSTAKFQSTLPSRERPSAVFTRLVSFNFNPRSQAGSDSFPSAAWSTAHSISIHAPKPGATFPLTVEGVFHLKFQSTLPSRERLCLFRSCRRCGSISIHAPKPGATLGTARGASGNSNFNPRSQAGSDLFYRRCG